MARCLLKDLNKSELLQMREQGMSNRDIANVLGCSYQTIRRAIGNQPFAKRRNYYYDAPMKTPTKQEEPQEVHEAALAVQRSALRLKGLFGEYEISDDGQTIEVTAPFNIVLNAEEIATFIKELQAIERNIDKVQPKLEMW